MQLRYPNRISSTTKIKGKKTPSKTHPKFIVAAAQAAPILMDLDGTIDKTIALMKQAADQGAKLVTFPETWIPGYPWWIWITNPAMGMQHVQRYFNNSMEVDSPEFKRLAKAANDLNIWLSFGFSERDGGSLYISQALIDDEGQVVLSRRKLKPTHVERTVFGDGDGSDLKVCETAIGNVGMLNCWEHLQPLSKYAMYSQHEHIHIAAWPSFSLYRGAAHALGAEVNNNASQIYAVEGGCFVLAPCGVVDQAMQDILCTEDAQRQMLQLGGGAARIYGPDGRQLGNIIPELEEGIVIAEIDLGLISLAKSITDPVGHYARPDATQLILNRERRVPVSSKLAKPVAASVISESAEAIENEVV
ncbi:carbon-nitrogen hydrolase family protein [Pseudomonas fluorescens]|nr:carbon-nitrogen hydrolase family protein [Pseudomonas fluorescens]MBH3398134.1 carbon-nitrogen hydrolase family protein [Pseudomonas fluorescens]